MSAPLGTCSPQSPCAPFKDTGGSREPGQGTHTHGTHTGHTLTRARTRAHGSHRRTSQPSKPIHTKLLAPAAAPRGARPGDEHRYN